MDAAGRSWRCVCGRRFFSMTTDPWCVRDTYFRRRGIAIDRDIKWPLLFWLQLSNCFLKKHNTIVKKIYIIWWYFDQSDFCCNTMRLHSCCYTSTCIYNIYVYTDYLHIHLVYNKYWLLKMHSFLENCIKSLKLTNYYKEISVIKRYLQQIKLLWKSKLKGLLNIASKTINCVV